MECLEHRLALATLTVTSLADSGVGTLRAAISDSVNRTGAGDGNDTIQFSSAIDGQTIKLTTFLNDLSAGSVMPGPSGLLIKNTNLTIDGETGLTKGVIISRDSTAAAFRLFFISTGADVTFKSVTLQGGWAKGGDGRGGGAAGFGGAIYNNGSVTILDSTLTVNKAQGGVGGISSSAQGDGGAGLGEDGGYSGVRLPENGGKGGGPNGGVGGSFGGDGGNGGFGGGGGGGQLVSSFGITLSKGAGGHGGFGGGGGVGGGGNYGTGERGGNGGFGGGGGAAGGGDYFGTAGTGGFGGGNASGANSGGGAGMGGAIFNEGGYVSISNSTLTGNSAIGGGNGSGLGGAIFNHNGNIQILYNTISLNTAANGGRGVYNRDDSASVAATVRINNTIIAQADTTVEDFTDTGDGITTGVGNLIGSQSGFEGSYSTGDPKLGLLQDNGGLTQTMALGVGSPAINQGNNSYYVYVDQRGSARNIAIPDIGAFELRTLQSITFAALPNRTYGDADFVITATASSNLPVTFTATGDASVQQVNGVWYAHINGAGSATITAKQGGNAEYESAPSVARSFTIAKAASVTTTIGAGPFTYNRVAQVGGSGTVTGVGGLSVSATSLTYSANSSGTGVADQTNAGTYYVTAHYAGDANYSPSKGAAVAIVINKANATVTVVGYTGIYDAANHGATGSASGLGGESAGTLNLGATFKDVPGGTARWVFTGNRNYKDQSGDVAIKILPKNITGNFTAANKVYDGNNTAVVLTRSLNGVLGTDAVTLSGGTATFASKNVGTWTVTLSGATLIGAKAGNYALISVATTTATITPKPLGGTADTQSALNIAKDGTLLIRIDLNKSGIVDGQSIAQLFNGASFQLTVGGKTFSIQSRAVVNGGNIHVSFQMGVELKALLARNTTATNGSKAPLVGLSLKAMSNDGNYELSAVAYTRLFNTGK